MLLLVYVKIIHGVWAYFHIWNSQLNICENAVKHKMLREKSEMNCHLFTRVKKLYIKYVSEKCDMSFIIRLDDFDNTQ